MRYVMHSAIALLALIPAHVGLPGGLHTSASCLVRNVDVSQPHSVTT